MEEKETFTYTYSAKEQEEIKAIRSKYAPREENAMNQLRKLDQSVTRKGTMAALVLGILSTLVFGTGMSCVMMWPEYMVIGILIGIIGMTGMAAAYPVYDRITRKERERVAPEILRLTEELMK